MAAHVVRPPVRLVGMERAAKHEATMAVAGASEVALHQPNPEMMEVTVLA